MTDTRLDELPYAEVRRSRWPSPVWLIPLIAVLVGAWLLYQYWAERGPVIEVPFPSAEGIVEGQTMVRYKHVAVGKVDKVRLAASDVSPELLPMVRIRLNKEITPLLNCNTQFWVVRPRIRSTEISGLGTLFSGTYIGMQPQTLSADSSHASFQSLCYEVLDGAPAVRPDRPGRQFILEAENMGSLDIGTPLFHKQMQVGEVVDYRLLRETGKIELKVFIEDPYYTFVKENTRFWNASGIEFKMDSTGAEFRMESLTSLIAGGIAFDTLGDAGRPSTVSAENTRFTLFKDYQTSREKHYKDRLYYVMYFDSSVRGLAVGAPVEYQGIKVGQVENIAMDMNPGSLDVNILVLVSIEPQRFAEDIELSQAKQMMQGLVERGIRAELQTGNLLTGKMFVALAHKDKTEPASIQTGQFHSVFPTSPTPVEELSRMALGIADDLKGTLAEVREFVEGDHLTNTVENVNQVLSDASDMMREADRALEDLRKMIKTVDETTLPAVTNDVNRITNSVVSVSNSVNKALPEVTDTVVSVGNSVNKALPKVTDTVVSVGNSVNKALPEVTNTVVSVGNSVNKALPKVTDTVVSVGNSVNKALPEVTNTVVSVGNSVNKALPEVTNTVVSVGNSVNKALPKVTNTVVSVGNSVNKTLPQVTNTLGKAGNDVTRVSNDLVKTMRRLQNSLGHMDRLLAQNSPTQYQLMEMMEELTAAAREIQALSERLERQPDSLIRGRR